MWPLIARALLLVFTFSACSASSFADFSPPLVFKNTNLLRSVDLTRHYSREIIAIIVENTSKEPQTVYYVPFAEDTARRISYIEARDKKGSAADFEVSAVNSTG